MKNPQILNQIDLVKQGYFQVKNKKFHRKLIFQKFSRELASMKRDSSFFFMDRNDVSFFPRVVHPWQHLLR